MNIHRDYTSLEQHLQELRAYRGKRERMKKQRVQYQAQYLPISRPRYYPLVKYER